jgi:L-asparaginase
MRKDSIDLTDDDREVIRHAVAEAPETRIVVTHGTDTMAETGRVLKAVPDKTIVLTGAMQPVRFRETDAVFNIATAIAAARLLPPGVTLAMNGRLFDPDRVRKNREEGWFEETGEDETVIRRDDDTVRR